MPSTLPMVPSLVSTGPVSPAAVPQNWRSVFLALTTYSCISSPARLSTARTASCPSLWGLYLVLELLITLISCNLWTWFYKVRQIRGILFIFYGTIHLLIVC